MKRAALFQSFCSFGRAGLSNMIPVLNTMGIETAPVPTAVLSTHLGFADPSVAEMGDQLLQTLLHWEREGILFDAVFCGYFHSENEVEILLKHYQKILKNDGLLLVDPIMGDHGKPYRGVMDGVIRKIRELCACAHLIVPNETELAMLLEQDPSLSSETVNRERMRAFAANEKPAVVLTGFERNGQIGSALCRQGEEPEEILHDRIPVKVHGSGDLFAAALLGNLLNEKSTKESIFLAEEFVTAGIEAYRQAGSSEKEGIPFEKILKMLDQEGDSWKLR